MKKFDLLFVKYFDNNLLNQNNLLIKICKSLSLIDFCFCQVVLRHLSVRTVR